MVTIVAVLAVLLTAGCTSSPEKEASNTSTSAPNDDSKTTSTVKDGARYVQINFLDGTSAGGEYVSETAAFTTIKVMYLLDPKAYTYINDSYLRDPDKYIVRGNGAEVGFKNELINTMINIEDPEAFIVKTQQEIKAEIDTAQKEYEKKMEEYAKAAAEREAKRTKPNN